MDTTTETLSGYVTSLRYEDLGPRTVQEAKRHILDSLGCAMGGYGSEPAIIARRVAPSGTPAARLLGEGRPTTPEAAAFANSVMIRFLDANDTYIARGSGHPSDMLGALLAAAELQAASGKDLVLATVAGYEVFGALADQVSLRDRGWDQGVFIAPASAAGAGRLLGLSAAQMANAIAIAASANVATRQTRAGELAMWKGCATAAAAKAGLFAAQLAQEGMTGPTAAFEGRHGLFEQVTGPFEIGALGGRGRPFAIERTNFKFFAAEYHAQAPLAMALALRGKVRTEEIEAIDVQIYAMAYSEIGSEPAKWDPRTRETADHSLPYMLAVALRDGRLTPASFEPQHYLDPSLRPLMNRIRVAESSEFTRHFPQELQSRIDVVTRSGQRFTEQATYPKGHARNPMTDADVETKFRDLSVDVLGDARVNAAVHALWHLDEAPRIGAVLDVLVRP
ncbi:MAG: MmgE/PrpD family protein [Candidatus Rokuibacteriota bacterium]|nr:MAG: MmgE/PrpD family protein [Candidatus Rokubacteria bacterium]